MNSSSFIERFPKWEKIASKYVIFDHKNLIFSPHKWSIANRSWEWHNLIDGIQSTKKVWYFRSSTLKNSTFFEKKLIRNNLAWITAIFWLLYKSISIFYPFFAKTLNFGQLVLLEWVTLDLFDIGGVEGVTWSLPSAKGLVIGSLLSLGGRKNHFFVSTVGWWNNYLHFLSILF